MAALQTALRHQLQPRLLMLPLAAALRLLRLLPRRRLRRVPSLLQPAKALLWSGRRLLQWRVVLLVPWVSLLRPPTAAPTLPVAAVAVLLVAALAALVLALAARVLAAVAAAATATAAVGGNLAPLVACLPPRVGISIRPAVAAGLTNARTHTCRAGSRLVAAAVAASVDPAVTVTVATLVLPTVTALLRRTPALTLAG